MVVCTRNLDPSAPSRQPNLDPQDILTYIRLGPKKNLKNPKFWRASAEQRLEEQKGSSRIEGQQATSTIQATQNV